MSEFKEFEFDSIPEIIKDIKNGKMVILIDDEDRENEGDLILAADHVNSEAINFMATQGRGLICLALSREQIDRLGLPLMIKDDLNQSLNGTAFTVSIEAAAGVTTGISAADRAVTVRVASDPNSTGKDITVPGHVFPIKAQQGGVLKRAGHTEASVDLSVLAGLNPAAVICEIMNEDGTMARVPELKRFARSNGLKIGTIEDLIEYRIEHDTFVDLTEAAPFLTGLGQGFDVKIFKNNLDGREHMAFVKGEISPEKPTLVRVHSENILGDVFCGELYSTRSNLIQALKKIDEAGSGILIYLRMEDMQGRLINRVKAYKQASIGQPLESLRKVFHSGKKDYGVGAQILRALGVRKIRLLSNSKAKMIGLKGYGLEIVETIPLKTDEVILHLREEAHE